MSIFSKKETQTKEPEKELTPEEKAIAKKRDAFDWIQCIVSALLACVLEKLGRVEQKLDRLLAEKSTNERTDHEK